MSRRKLVIAVAFLFFGIEPGVFAQGALPSDAVSRMPAVQHDNAAPAGSLPVNARGLMIGSTGSCSAVREKTAELLHVVAAALTPAAREAALRLASKETGSPTAQSWHDVAVMIYLRGNMPLAAWAALTAASDAWQEIFIGDAGTILLALGRNEEGVQFLRCAYETGDRSPYLLEALASGYARLGKRIEARQVIDEVTNDVIDVDPVIYIEKSFLDTGKPPPPSPPPEDELKRCLSVADSHAGRIVAGVAARDRKLDQLLNTPNRREGIIAGFVQSRAKEVAALQAMNDKFSATPEGFDSALAYCVTWYSLLTLQDIDNVLAWAHTEAVFFWSDVLRTGPEVFAGDTDHGQGQNYGQALGLTSLADFRRWHDEMQAANDQHIKDDKVCMEIRGPQDNRPCLHDAQFAYCKVWQEIHDRLATSEEERYNNAAHGFDPAATRLVWAMQDELADAQGFISQEIGKFKPASQQFVQMTMKGLTDSFNKMQTMELGKLDRFLRGEADWFLFSQKGLRQFIEGEQQNINIACEKVLNPPKLDSPGQDEWQKVLAHFSSDFDSNIDCYVEIDSAKAEWDQREKRELSGKWKNIKAKFDLSSHKLTITGNWKWTLPSTEDIPEEGEVTVSPSAIVKDGSLVGAGVDSQVTEGPMIVKGGVTLLSDTNPNTGVKEPAVGFSATAGLGLHGKVAGTKVGTACFPGKGTAKVYPRGLLQDAINYLVAVSH
jgi:hypothetical protein